MSASAPYRLPVRFLEKVWGSEDQAPWYPSQGKKIGEVWFEADIPLLVKFIFTTDKLSVQVHPDDAFAAAHEHSRGKTEMWYVLRADPGAQIAMGFQETITRERLRDASLNGEIMSLLNWINVEAGDVFFVPAGTVHAIGAGLAMCEIQQFSDVTYRLFDYGRPRELHLDKATQVASIEAIVAKPVMLPVDCNYFHTELAKINSTIDYTPPRETFHLLVFLAGMGEIAGQPFREGETWLVPRGAPGFEINPAIPTKFLRTWIP